MSTRLFSAINFGLVYVAGFYLIVMIWGVMDWRPLATIGVLFALNVFTFVFSNQDYQE